MELIDRQAAIDAVRSYYDEFDTSDKSIEERIKALPSAQPNVHDTNVGDLISRQAAIEAIKCAIWDKYTAKDAIDAVCNVPPAERKKGEWIRHILKTANVPWGFDCSACGAWFVIGEDTAERYNFCPNCGAEMRGEEG